MIDRHHYSLYVTNINERTDENRLISLFSEFGPVQSYTMFRKSSRRHNVAAIITFDVSVDTNQIIDQCDQIVLDGNTVLLRRPLPPLRPAFERFMTSNLLVLSLSSSVVDERFDKKSIEIYFQRYGSINSCQVVVPIQCYLIKFDDIHSVDKAIIGGPHFFNDHHLIIYKYIPPERLETFQLREKRIHFSPREQIRRLEDLIEATKISQQIQWKLIRRFYEEKLIHLQRIDRLTNFIRNLRRDFDRIQQMNKTLKSRIESNQKQRNDLIEFYRERIEHQQLKSRKMTKT